jgi:CheY-like chemotaxis protein
MVWAQRLRHDVLNCLDSATDESPMTPPHATLDSSLRPQQQSVPVRQVGASRPLRCFLVEDNAVIRQNLIATLEEMLTVEVIGTAADELEALRWMQSGAQGCDLLVIDLFLKHGSGFGVLASAQELVPQVHRVVLSNYATPDIRRRCLALGAERVFDKSAELEDLLDHCGALGARPR